MLDRFIAPGVLDLIRIEFERKEQADAFTPPAWFGPEVTRDAAYDRGSLARGGIPHGEDIALSNAALEELLDTLENGFGAFQFGALSFGRSEASRGAPPEDARMDSIAAGLAEALDMGGSAEPSEHEPNVIVPAGSRRIARPALTTRLHPNLPRARPSQPAALFFFARRVDSRKGNRPCVPSCRSFNDDPAPAPPEQAPADGSRQFPNSRSRRLRSCGVGSVQPLSASRGAATA